MFFSLLLSSHYLLTQTKDFAAKLFTFSHCFTVTIFFFFFVSFNCFFSLFLFCVFFLLSFLVVLFTIHTNYTVLVIYFFGDFTVFSCFFLSFFFFLYLLVPHNCLTVLFFPLFSPFQYFVFFSRLSFCFRSYALLAFSPTDFFFFSLFGISFFFSFSSFFSSFSNSACCFRQSRQHRHSTTVMSTDKIRLTHTPT